MERIHVVALLAVRDDRLLVVRKQGTERWMQPGGKPEAGETLEDALRREVREELGGELKNLRFFDHFETTAANEPGATLVADVMFAEFVGDPVAAAEIEAVAWLTREELQRGEIAPLIRKCLPVDDPEPNVMRPENKLLAAWRGMEPSAVRFVRHWPSRESNLRLALWADKIDLPGETSFGALIHDLRFEGDRAPFDPMLWEKLGRLEDEWFSVAWLNRGEFFEAPSAWVREGLMMAWSAGPDEILVMPESDRFLLYLSGEGTAYFRAD